MLIFLVVLLSCILIRVVLVFCFFLTHVSTGYRSVPLKNGYSENLELASLLVYIEIQQAEVSKHTWSVSQLIPRRIYGCVIPLLVSVIQKAQEDLYTSSNQLKKDQAEHSEPFLYDMHSNIQRSVQPRQQSPLVREASERHSNRYR